MTSLSSRFVLSAAAIAVAAFACYWGTFHYPFQFDDEPMFVNADPSGFLKDTRTIWNFNPSRFLNFLSLGINYWIGGTDTFGYHIVNFAIHLANALLVWRLMEIIVRLERDRSNGRSAEDGPARLIPLFTALVFAAHPLQTQAVTYIWQRPTSLSAFFYLLALLSYLHFASGAKDANVRPGWLAVSLLSALAAMFTKQIAVTLPVAVAVADYYFVSRSLSGLRRRMTVLAAYVPVLLVIPVLSAMGYSREMSDVAERVSRVPSQSTYLFTQFNVIATYLRLLIWPAGQNLDYSYPWARSLSDCWPSLILLSAIFAWGVWLFRRNTIASFGVMFFFLALAVESSIFPLEDVIFEHRAYLPSVGAFAAFWALTLPAAGTIAAGKRKGRIIAAALMTIILIPLIIATRARNEVWKDKVTLWTDVVSKSPNKIRGYAQLGLAHMDAGRLDEAETWFKKALAIYPKDIFAHFKLGRVYEKRGDDTMAVSEFKAVIANEGRLAIAHEAIGNILLRGGDCGGAVQSFVNAANLAPGMVEFRVKLGRALEKCGHKNDAQKVFENVLKMEPDNIEARKALDAPGVKNDGGR